MISLMPKDHLPLELMDEGTGFPGMAKGNGYKGME
jgi:hypothetical protein